MSLLGGFRPLFGGLLLVGMQLEFGHGMLKTGPFFRSQSDELQTELAGPAPANHSLLHR